MSFIKDFTQDLFSGMGSRYSGKGLGSPYFPNKNPGPAGKAAPPNAGKTNILNNQGGGNNLLPIINNHYSNYKSILNTLESYEYYHLTERMLELIKDYVIRILDYNSDIITPIDPDITEERKQDFDRINEVLRSIDFRNLLIRNIDKLNYYGSTSYAISYTTDEESKTNSYKLSRLASPHNVVIIKKDTITFYLVETSVKNANTIGNRNSANDSITSNVTILTDDKLLYLGSNDLELKHDTSSLKIIDEKIRKKKSNTPTTLNKYGVDQYLKEMVDNKLEPGDQDKEGSIVDQPDSPVNTNEAFNLNDNVQSVLFKKITADEYNISASKPLYYSIHQKVKEYLTKDIILNVLGVKTSIQPSYLTWGIDAQYGYTIDEMMNLVGTLEGRLNTSIDIDILNSANLNMDSLVNRIISNIRIIPDLGHNIRSVESKEVDDVTRKVEELSRRKMEVKEEILESVGLPRDLYEGASNREEVLKRDERFQSMVLKMINRLRTSVKSAVSTFCKLEGIQIDETEYTVSMFKKSGIEYHFNTTKLDSIRDMVTTLMSVMADVQQLSQFDSTIDPMKLMNFIRTQLLVVGDDVADLIPTQEEYMEMMKQQQKQ